MRRLVLVLLPIVAVAATVRWEDVPPSTPVDFASLTSLGAARPLPKYLHELSFDDTYPAAAEDYYRSRGDGKVDGGCSAVRDGGFLYRNFDYPFDDRAEFVVRMSAANGRFASIGVAQVGTNLTEEIVTSGKPSKWYKALPGATVDGINEHGVVAEINVVGGEPRWRYGGDIHPLAAVRWVLDNSTSAELAASNLAVRISFPEGWTQNYQYMIADADETYIVADGNYYYYPVTNRVALTNFQNVPTREYGPGQERYDILMGGANITNAWYTRAYRRETNPPWLSEFDNNYEYLNAALNRWNDGRTKEQHRGESYTQTTYPYETITWWQTVHTSVYDIEAKTLRIAVQETDDWYTFALAPQGGVIEETDPTVPAWAKNPVPPATGVTSVNGATGAVVLGASDVGAVEDGGAWNSLTNWYAGTLDEEIGDAPPADVGLSGLWYWYNNELASSGARAGYASRIAEYMGGLTNSSATVRSSYPPAGLGLTMLWDWYYSGYEDVPPAGVGLDILWSWYNNGGGGIPPASLALQTAYDTALTNADWIAQFEATNAPALPPDAPLYTGEPWWIVPEKHPVEVQRDAHAVTNQDVLALKTGDSGMAWDWKLGVAIDDRPLGYDYAPPSGDWSLDPTPSATLEGEWVRATGTDGTARVSFATEGNEVQTEMLPMGHWTPGGIIDSLYGEIGGTWRERASKYALDLFADVPPTPTRHITHCLASSHSKDYIAVDRPAALSVYTYADETALLPQAYNQSFFSRDLAEQLKCVSCYKNDYNWLWNAPVTAISPHYGVRAWHYQGGSAVFVTNLVPLLTMEVTSTMVVGTEDLVLVKFDKAVPNYAKLIDQATADALSPTMPRGMAGMYQDCHGEICPVSFDGWGSRRPKWIHSGYDSVTNLVHAVHNYDSSHINFVLSPSGKMIPLFHHWTVAGGTPCSYNMVEWLDQKVKEHSKGAESVTRYTVEELQ